MKTLEKLKNALINKQEDKIQKEIIRELQGHNLLADLQKKEKALATELKNLKLELQNEKGFYEVEMKEKKILAQKYKEDLNKAETESFIKNTYQVDSKRERNLILEKRIRDKREVPAKDIERKGRGVAEREERDYLVFGARETSFRTDKGVPLSLIHI